MTIDPLRTKVAIKQQTQLLSNPGRSVNAIRYRGDWNFVFGKIGPNDLPHLSRHPTMKMTHGIPPSAHAQRKNGHVEGIAKAAKLHELLLADAEVVPKSGEVFLHHVERKGVMAGGNRSMGRKNACRANLFRGFCKSLALLHELARALEQHECGMPFIAVKHRGLNAKGPQDADSAHTQHDFLPNAVFFI